MKKNNKSIIILSIILTLVLTTAILAYLFFMTDMFKSNKELFAKYFAQNTETFEKIMDLKIVDSYNNTLNQTKYKSETNVKMTHSEGGEISNLINDFSAQIDIRKNAEEEYLYADAQMIYKDEECLEAEIMKDKGLYGVKFPGIAKKFVTIQQDEKLEAIAKDMGIDVMYLETLMNIMDGNVQISSEEQINALKDKYLNIITTGLSKGRFEKQKNALITYNNATVKTNAYSVLLNGEEVRGVVIEILNNLKAETNILNELKKFVEIENLINEAITNVTDAIEIPTVKITTYEQKQQTIRTVCEIGAYKVIIENANGNEEIKSKIIYNEETNQYECEISKENVENEEKLEVVMNVTEGDKNYTAGISYDMKLLSDEIQVNAEASYKEDITTKSIVLENKTISGVEIEKTQSLTEANAVVLNNLEETIRQQFIAELKERMPQKIDDKIEEKVENPNEEPVENEEISQVEINKFNAKFEFYTGEEVSEDNVRKLLDVVKNNIIGHLITTIENPDATSSNKKQMDKITIYIEKDKTNEESMTEILGKIEKNKKYAVSISYKESNGLIDSISITQK